MVPTDNTIFAFAAALVGPWDGVVSVSDAEGAGGLAVMLKPVGPDDEHYYRAALLPAHFVVRPLWGAGPVWHSGITAQMAEQGQCVQCALDAACSRTASNPPRSVRRVRKTLSAPPYTPTMTRDPARGDV